MSYYDKLNREAFAVQFLPEDVFDEEIDQIEASCYKTKNSYSKYLTYMIFA